MPNSPPTQECYGHKVVPSHVYDSLRIVSTTSAFRVAYTGYHGPSTVRSSSGKLVLRAEARRRIAQDVLEHVRSCRTWFPDYVLCACYKPS